MNLEENSRVLQNNLSEHNFQIFKKNLLNEENFL